MQYLTQCRKYWHYFPSLCPVAQNLVDEVENMLVHAICGQYSLELDMLTFHVFDPNHQTTWCQNSRLRHLMSVCLEIIFLR